MDFQPLDRKLPFKGVEAIDSSVLEAFPYEFPGQKIDVEIETQEFTAVCPFSGMPDFGRLKIRYIPDKLCVELRSLKYYLLSYRHVGIFYEHLVNRVLEDLVNVCKPVEMTVEADYTVRGGLKTRAVATWRSESDQVIK
ncbi:NADPH-dependent 7-cyano-7-deazaguanine reductase QueF [bacterium]|nr:NADPH-dependent 7-cyano-7-deazaguanine reductase QueF [bacterium]